MDVKTTQVNQLLVELEIFRLECIRLRALCEQSISNQNSIRPHSTTSEIDDVNIEVLQPPQQPSQDQQQAQIQDLSEKYE
jgi:hypothetical protein